jgi:hypothetical protein
MTLQFVLFPRRLWTIIGRLQESSAVFASLQESITEGKYRWQ